MVSNRKMKQRLGIKGKVSNSRRSTERVKQKITTE